MSIAYKINEVSKRSGFTPATLRYYEEIGLLPEPARTASGYRMYDERTLERLAFIARAKQLGCTLEETADLVVAWDGGQCGPIQDRLRILVAAKVDDAQRKVVELTTFTAELRQAAAALEGHRPDGPCDDGCGCGPIPLDAPPLACSLSADSMKRQVDEWNQLLGWNDGLRTGVISRSVVDGRVRLELHQASTSEARAWRCARRSRRCRWCTLCSGCRHE